MTDVLSVRNRYKVKYLYQFSALKSMKSNLSIINMGQDLRPQPQLFIWNMKSVLVSLSLSLSLSLIKSIKISIYQTSFCSKPTSELTINIIARYMLIYNSFMNFNIIYYKAKITRVFAHCILKTYIPYMYNTSLIVKATFTYICTTWQEAWV